MSEVVSPVLRLTSSLAWRREHDAWLGANAGAANDAPAHRQVVLTDSLDRGEQDGSRAVDDPDELLA